MYLLSLIECNLVHDGGSHSVFGGVVREITEKPNKSDSRYSEWPLLSSNEDGFSNQVLSQRAEGGGLSSMQNP